MEKEAKIKPKKEWAEVFFLACEFLQLREYRYCCASVTKASHVLGLSINQEREVSRWFELLIKPEGIPKMYPWFGWSHNYEEQEARKFALVWAATMAAEGVEMYEVH